MEEHYKLSKSKLEELLREQIHLCADKIFDSNTDISLSNKCMNTPFPPLPEPIKQEPVGYLDGIDVYIHDGGMLKKRVQEDSTPLYLSPPIEISEEEIEYRGVLLGLNICNDLLNNGELTQDNIYENKVYYKELIENLKTKQA